MRFPSSRRSAGVVTNTPNPIATAMVAALDVGNGLRLAGRAGGAVRIGIKGGTARSYRGDLGPLQQFRGYAGPASGQANRRVGRGTSLPSTSTPTPTLASLFGRKK